jgi:hypothetical protein
VAHGITGNYHMQLGHNVDGFPSAIQRYGWTEAEKWRFNKEIWSQEQSENQTVDDYVTSMQIRATRVGTPQHTLKYAIIQGLKPELRLFVLNAKIPDIPTVLTVARTCEAARSADKVKSSDDIGQLKAMVNSLINKMDKITGAENDNNTYIKKVTFAQGAVTPAECVRSHDVYDRSSSRRSVSPGDRRDYARNRLRSVIDRSHQEQWDVNLIQRVEVPLNNMLIKRA